MNQNPIEQVLASDHPAITAVMQNLEAHQVQIRYTQINRSKDSVVFTDFDFQVDSTNYFYPASTAKFPAAVAALEKLNQVDSLSLDSRFFVEGDSTITTFSRAIEELFAVSDNAANNRLIEFLGFNELNQRITQRGVTPFRVSHRLSTSDADNIVTKPLIFFSNDSTTTMSKIIEDTAATPLTLNQISKGVGFMRQDSLHQEPFDFSLKNYFPVAAQSGLLKRIFFSKTFPPTERFDFSPAQLEFIQETMGKLPYQVGYDRTHYYDSYVKF